MEAPLAERIRPKTLEDYIGQSHLVGPKGTLTLQLQNGILSSMILWGPPGVGLGIGLGFRRSRFGPGCSGSGGAEGLQPLG